MRPSFYRFFASAVVVLSLFGSVGVAQASSLSSTQISAIIGLLQSFGADQNTINNVSAALDGSTTNSGLSCTSFSDVSYGQFDNNPGGRVSQLQTWLGISPTTFGFGTYGKKTQAVWKSKCGGVTVTQTQTNTVFTATPTTGAAPLAVMFNSQFVGAGHAIDFGDGHSMTENDNCLRDQNCRPIPIHVQDTHTYASPGTYTAKLLDDSQQNILGTVTITVTGGSTLNVSSATIDQNNVTPSAGSFSITGSIHNSTGLSVFISTARGDAISYSVDYSTMLAQSQREGVYQASATSVANGRWSASFAWSSIPGPTAIGVYVYDSTTHALLTRGTLTIAGTGSIPSTPSATIDQSSLTTSSLTPTITGHASGVASVNVEVVDSNGARIAQDNATYTATTGVWSFPINASTETRNSAGMLSLNTPGTYSVIVYGLVAGSGVQLATGTLTIHQ